MSHLLLAALAVVAVLPLLIGKRRTRLVEPVSQRWLRDLWYRDGRPK